MNCTFVNNICTRCGVVINPIVLEKFPTVKRNCPAIDAPSFSTKLFNFTKASINHAISGFQKASDEVVEERWAICQACELFILSSPGKATCGHDTCGCNLSGLSTEDAAPNKLRWAEQECPLLKWRHVSK